jgi:ATP-dependent Clp protease ATP-binding subunit ClpC
MFERFTDPARQVVVYAQDEARALMHNYIGTEHLLLGLLREQDGIGARVLESLGTTLEEVRAQVARIVGQGDDPVTTGQIPFTPRAKKLLELSLREALSLGHNYIGTEHLLLALARENGGVAIRILWDTGVGDENVREGVRGPVRDPCRREYHWRLGKRNRFVPPGPAEERSVTCSNALRNGLARSSYSPRTRRVR